MHFAWPSGAGGTRDRYLAPISWSDGSLETVRVVSGGGSDGWQGEEIGSDGYCRGDVLAAQRAWSGHAEVGAVQAKAVAAVEGEVVVGAVEEVCLGPVHTDWALLWMGCGERLAFERIGVVALALFPVVFLAGFFGVRAAARALARRFVGAAPVVGATVAR